MKIYTEEVTCEVCGGEGVARPSDAAKSWSTEGYIRHKDPSICAEILKRKLHAVRVILETSKIKDAEPLQFS